MKRVLLTALLATFGYVAMAQNLVVDAAVAAAVEDAGSTKETVAPAKHTNWTNSIQFALGFNQTGLFNWAAGGYNTVTLSTGADAKANYAKGLMSWNNRLQLNYAFLWSADKANILQSNNDRIYLESKWSYKTSTTSFWNYTASFDFRTQFADNYSKYNPIYDSEDTKKIVGWSGVLKSGLLAPAYTNIALGMEWKPTKWFDVSIAPLTGGFTIVTRPSLRKTYGMVLIEEGMDPSVGTNYTSALFQFGAQIKSNLKASLNDVFSYETQLVLFTDYLNKPFRYVRINWDNKINWKVSKLFAIGFNTWLIYDPIVIIDDIPGKVQFKEFLSVSFTYTISNKK